MHIIKTVVVAGAATLWAGAALACPNLDTPTENYKASGDQLYAPKSFSVVAGGDMNLQGCGFQDAFGYAMTAADFGFNLSNMGPYNIAISVVSDCDAMLLINDPNADWYFDDDSNGNADPRIVLPGYDGLYNIWIGTYDGAYCDATLTLETL